jgi:hypothetical protein
MARLSPRGSPWTFAAGSLRPQSWNHYTHCPTEHAQYWLFSGPILPVVSASSAPLGARYWDGGTLGIPFRTAAMLDHASFIDTFLRPRTAPSRSTSTALSAHSGTAGTLVEHGGQYGSPKKKKKRNGMRIRLLCPRIVSRPMLNTQSLYKPSRNWRSMLIHHQPDRNCYICGVFLDLCCRWSRPPTLRWQYKRPCHQLINTPCESLDGTSQVNVHSPFGLHCNYRNLHRTRWSVGLRTSTLS